jgi:hypothetical protein
MFNRAFSNQSDARSERSDEPILSVPWTDDEDLIAREEYMRAHPEIITIIRLLKIEILRTKPDNISQFAAKFFSQKNRPKLESALSMKLK